MAVRAHQKALVGCWKLAAAAAAAGRRCAAIFVPSNASVDSGAGGRPSEAQLLANIDAITAPVRSDMEIMNANLMSIVGERHPMLMAAAEQIFGAGGKKLRPVLCFLVARATAQAQGIRCVRLARAGCFSGAWADAASPLRRAAS
jgi:hypothetical protein